MESIDAGRCDLPPALRLAALRIALASASPLNPAHTIIRMPADHGWPAV